MESASETACASNVGGFGVRVKPEVDAVGVGIFRGSVWSVYEADGFLCGHVFDKIFNVARVFGGGLSFQDVDGNAGAPQVCRQV